jgi:hypothetical protein
MCFLDDLNIFAAGWDNSESEVSELSELAKTTLANFNQSAQLSSLDTAVMLYRNALLLRPNPHPKQLVSLGGLAAALYAWFCRTDDISNLDEAISVLYGAVETCSASDTYLEDLLRSLSAVVTTRLGKTGQIMDLQVATRHDYVLQLPSSLPTNDEKEAIQLINFWANLIKQFKQSCQMTDLKTVILLGREGRALLAVHHPNWYITSNNLTVALSTRFKHSGQWEYLDESISVHQEVLELFPTNPD